MLESLKFRRELKKLFAEREKHQQLSDEHIEKARKEGKDKEEIEVMREMAAHEYFKLQDEIRQVTSTHHFQKAHKLIVPLPDLSDEELWTKAITS